MGDHCVTRSQFRVPTNHIELEAGEELETALLEFPGAVIFVSHDRYLVNNLADRIVELKDYAHNPLPQS